MMDYTIFGESHGPAVGVLLRDVPPGLPVDEEFICRQLLRRAPQDPLSTARHEPDQVEVLSGVYQGVTTGMPVCLLLRNRDVRSADYDALRHTPRPSHADYTAWVQSGGRNDPRGGGAFSGRLTAPLVVPYSSHEALSDPFQELLQVHLQHFPVQIYPVSHHIPGKHRLPSYWYILHHN